MASTDALCYILSVYMVKLLSYQKVDSGTAGWFVRQPKCQATDGGEIITVY